MNHTTKGIEINESNLNEETDIGNAHIKEEKKQNKALPSKQKGPHIVLKRLRPLNNWDVVTITNKRLSIQTFKRKEGGYKYYYRFTIGKAHGLISLIVKGEDFARTFEDARGRFEASREEIEPARKDGSVPSAIEIQGNNGVYSIAFIIRNAKLPLFYEGTVGKIAFKVQCSGHIQQSRSKRKSTDVECEGVRTPVSLPKSVVWAAKHPFSGGGVSPR